MADTENPHGKKQKPQIKDHSLWQLENIAREVLKNTESYIQRYRVDIEKLIEAKYNIIIDKRLLKWLCPLEVGLICYTCNVYIIFMVRTSSYDN